MNIEERAEPTPEVKEPGTRKRTKKTLGVGVERILRIEQVSEMTGMEKSTLYSRMKTDPTFPRPIALGDKPNSARGFFFSEILSWLQERERVEPGRIAVRRIKNGKTGSMV